MTASTALAAFSIYQYIAFFLFEEQSRRVECW
jgi:hypothetical protein